MNIKNLAIVTFVFFAFTKIQSQVTFRPGIQAGVNISKLTATDLDSKTDF